MDEALGRGSTGEVWRAVDQALDRAVAVKLLHAQEETDTERFRLEAQTAGRLNHPHVVSVYDFGSDHDQPYLVMELIKGRTLAQERSLRGTLPPHEAAGIAAQMAAGLSAAHGQGVIHRDIKPANVMLTTDRTAKITDFGIARFANDAASTLTATGKIVGTADYLAPERALGRAAQPSSDVYSLGCVLYELLTGGPPFLGSTSLAVVQQHVDAIPVAPTRLRPEIPGPLADYLLRLLAKDPAHRPTAEQAAAWLAGPWHEEQPRDTAPLLEPPVATAPPRTIATRVAHSGPHDRRKGVSKAVLGGAGVLLFVAAIALGTSLNSGDDAPSSPVPASTAPITHAPTSAAPLSDVPSTTPSPSLPPRPLEDRQGQEERSRDEQHGKGKERHGQD
ncbi:serine/threonine-protein kinase [Streptomyces albiflavescens]|uniref:serine/threonine-protein kinase n=1 Tax=Streptomyces albiflavescens TaxID=1623582 RepID=UPI001E5893F9|nr:serine/threonine-protein kinase [Streptomyces albiflavescens]